ncbi:MAG: DUF1385 domain-containing protein [Dehalococcoidales bacterium]|nr:DUF1385 domain-containing protein [Dehalococcoidales bacterium]
MAERFYYGGQAVLEGVMMRGQKAAVTVVRRPDGELAADTRMLSAIYTGRMRKSPLLRGIIVLVEAMVLGVRSLFYSANVSLEEEGEEVSGPMVWLMVIASLALAVGLFFIAPLFLTRLLNISSSLVFNLVDGVIRVAIFIAYLKVMALLPDIKRVFAYHGAEHMTINAYEAGVPLEVEAIRKYGTAHVRCGTSFLFAVLIISIVVFALIGLHSPLLMVLSRLVLIPVIAALGYEVVYFSARYTGNGLVRAILAPGLWLQSLTTREPDDTQLEVALSALKRVMEIDGEQESPVGCGNHCT